MAAAEPAKMQSQWKAWAKGDTEPAKMQSRWKAWAKGISLPSPPCPHSDISRDKRRRREEAAGWGSILAMAS
ncbi:hypothetical protein ACP4OV_014821 [Aristida adscensionis]